MATDTATTSVLTSATRQDEALVQRLSRGDQVLASVVLETPAPSMASSLELARSAKALIEDHLGHGATVRIAPAGVVAVVTVHAEEPFDGVLHRFGSLRDVLACANPVVAPATTSSWSLCDSVGYAGTGCELGLGDVANAPVQAAVCAGPNRDLAELRDLRLRLLQVVGEPRCAGHSLGAAVMPDFAATTLWMIMAGAGSSLTRWYRPLPPPASRQVALARSLGNAIVGGSPESRLARLVRDEKQLSYDPISLLNASGGSQWLVVSAATGLGQESELREAIRSVFEQAQAHPPTRHEIASATKFMLNQRRTVSQSATFVNQLQLAWHDGSDPNDIASASRDELLAVDPALVAAEVRATYDPARFRRCVVSPLSEPEELE